MSIVLEGTISPVPVLFIGDLKNKTARLVLEMVHVETGRALGQVEVVVQVEDSPETEIQESTPGWDAFMAANPEGPAMQQALVALAGKMAPLSKILSTS